MAKIDHVHASSPCLCVLPEGPVERWPTSLPTKTSHLAVVKSVQVCPSSFLSHLSLLLVSATLRARSTPDRLRPFPSLHCSFPILSPSPPLLSFLRLRHTAARRPHTS